MSSYKYQGKQEWTALMCLLVFVLQDTASGYADQAGLELLELQVSAAISQLAIILIC